MNTRRKYNSYDIRINRYIDEHTTDNTNIDSQFESYIYEECQWCGKDMIDLEDIWVETESDDYVCKSCADKYKLDVVRCMDLGGTK